MPAAAVIPAPIAYIKVVAVKKLVVGSQAPASGPSNEGSLLAPVLPAGVSRGSLHRVPVAAGTFTLKKLECSRQALRLNNGAWNNGIGPRFYFVGLRSSR